MSRFKVTNALIVAGNACRKSKIQEIEEMIRDASKAAEILFKETDPSDVRGIGQSETLFRLTHNALAFKMMLEQAKDAAQIMSAEIAEILKAIDDKDREEEERRKATIERMRTIEVRKGQYERAKAKKQEKAEQAE